MKYIEGIIAKYIAGELTERENVELQRWLAEKPEREEKFRALLNRDDFTTRYRRYAAIDSDAAKGRFLHRVRPVRLRLTLRRTWYYAAALVPLLLLSMWFFRQEAAEAPQFTLEEVQPGIAQATLIMDNGVELALTGKSNQVVALDDTLSADMEDGAITYRPSTAKAKIEYHTIVVPRGGEYRITLSDGSRVHINSESQLRFPVTFTGEERLVQLTGEAYFEVARVENRPFVVEAGGARVRQYGTKFNINAYGEAPEVVLVSGNIGVSGEGLDEVTLVPGQLAVCGENIVVTDVDITPYIEWTQGRFTFENRPLAEIVPSLVRWYDVDIVLDDEVSARRFTGSVSRSETIEHIMNAISYTQEVRVAVKGNKIEIYK